MGEETVQELDGRGWVVAVARVKKCNVGVSAIHEAIVLGHYVVVE